MSANGVPLNSEVPFTLLEEGKPRWRAFGAGFGIEFLLLVCAAWLPMMFPKQMVAAKYLVTGISVPYIPEYKPQPTVQPRRVARRPEVVKEIPKPVELPKPKIIEPVFAKLNVERPVVKNNPTPAPKINEFALMAPDTLSLGNSATPDLKKPKAPVQTGGFGDPEGLATNARKMTQPANINATGDFDLPEGAGQGNGKGKARGVVESAGFGNETAIAGGERNSGHVQTGAFADDRPTDNGPQARKAAAAPDEDPVVILYKPEPQYTTEGRQLKIQGAVVLQVVFKASGQVEVLKVVQGLGHGLDENAEAAARQIRFTPAKADGQPVDFPANVRIDFELAY